MVIDVDAVKVKEEKEDSEKKDKVVVKLWMCYYNQIDSVNNRYLLY